MAVETETTTTSNQTSSSDPSSSQLDVQKSEIVQPRSTRQSYYRISVLAAFCVVMMLAIFLLFNYGSSTARYALRTESTGEEDMTIEEVYFGRAKATAPHTTTETATVEEDITTENVHFNRGKAKTPPTTTEMATDESQEVPSESRRAMKIPTILEAFTDSELTSESEPSAKHEVTRQKVSPSIRTTMISKKFQKTQERNRVNEITEIGKKKETSKDGSTFIKASTNEKTSEETSPQPTLSDTGDTSSPQGPLLCTTGDFAVSKVMFPPDGLCDLLFYTHVWFLEGDFHGRYNEKSWETFKKLAPSSEKTGFGISASYDDANDMRAALKGTGRVTIKNLRKKKILHYGILRAEGNSTSFKSDLSSRLKLLNDFTKLQNEFNGPSSEGDADVVLGIRFTEYLDEKEVAKHPAVITELTRKLPITLFILQTHVEKRMGVTPVIGTMSEQWDDLQRPPLNVPTLVEAISSLKVATIAEDIPVLASFTMLVGRFWLNQSFSLPPSTWEATSWTKAGFDMTCKYNATFDKVITSSLRYMGIKENELFCFEDSDTMIEKARRVKFDYNISSWAIFDVEFEDHDNACGEGAFHRIKELKNFLGHFL